MTGRQGPFFIAGTDRAGKTLLSAILASHPRLYVSAVGSNMWTLFYRRFGDLSDPRRFERCLAAMLAYKHVRFLEPDVGRLRADFVAGPPTYARLFALIHEQAAERAGKARWGDQTGLIEGYADHVLAAYPGAVMIHMIRDPRDRYDASLTRWPEGRLRVGGAVARWLYSARHARRNLRRHGDRYLVVRYEDLADQPEVVARRVCDFLGEEFVPDMLELRGMPSYRNKLLTAAPDPNGDGLISNAYVGIHHGRIPADELIFMERRAGRLMRSFGYETGTPPLRGLARLRHAAVGAPLNTGRMAAWSLRQRAAELMPRLAGRRPPRHHRVHDGR